MKIKLSFFITLTWWIRKKSCQREDELCSFTCHCNNIFLFYAKHVMDIKTREALHSLRPSYRHDTTFLFWCNASPSGGNSQGFSSKSVLWVALWPSSVYILVHHSAQSNTALGHKPVFLGTVCTIPTNFTVLRVSLEYIWRIIFIY